MSGDPIMSKDLNVELFSGEQLVGTFTAKLMNRNGIRPCFVDEFVFGTLKMVVTTETAYGTRSVEGSRWNN